MIRILHLADIHLGMENYGRVDPATGLSSRLGDFLASLDTALDYAVTQHIDLVLLAGDDYKNRDPSPTIQRELFTTNPQEPLRRTRTGAEDA